MKAAGWGKKKPCNQIASFIRLRRYHRIYPNFFGGYQALQGVQATFAGTRSVIFSLTHWPAASEVEKTP